MTGGGGRLAPGVAAPASSGRLARRAGQLVDHGVLLTQAIWDRAFGRPARQTDRALRGAEWKYESAPERERHDLVRRLVSAHRPRSWGRVLEVGCAEGHFSVVAAAHAELVVALDVSSVACTRAAARCAHLPHVRVEHAHVERDSLPEGPFDVIVAMDVLEYVHGRARLAAVAARLERVLSPGGLLAVTATRLPAHVERSWWARRLVEGGTQIVDFLGGRPTLRVLHRELHPAAGGRTVNGYCPHVIALFSKTEG